ncbi:hypothetical protein ACEF17_06135 [Streptococcus hyovaginalis]
MIRKQRTTSVTKEWTRLFRGMLRKSQFGILAYAFVYTLGYFGYTVPLAGFFFCLGILFFKNQLIRFLKKGIQMLYAHKKWVMLAAFTFQILLLLSAKLLIRRDAAVVFTGAFHYLPSSSISAYITRNPNNLFLFLYQRLFYNLFGKEALGLLLGLNIFYIHSYTWLMDRLALRHFSQSTAQYAFSFNILLIGFTPLFLTLYTDVLALPLLALQVELALKLLKARNMQGIWRVSSLLGLLSGIIYLIRPTGLILPIALLLSMFLQKRWHHSVLFLSVFMVSLASVSLISQEIKQHQREIKIIKGAGLAKTPLAFIDLGLTHSGTDQADFKDGLLQYVNKDKRNQYNNGMFNQKFVIAEIKRRLSDFTVLSFTQHLLIKLGNTFRQGNFGWAYYENLKKEKTPFVSPLYPYLKPYPIFKTIRYLLISVDTKPYKVTFSFLQIIWLLLLIGLFFSAGKPFPHSDQTDFLHLAIFGGLLFLMIFEGGKARYLLQFFPQILLLASLGLQSRSRHNIDIKSS